MVLSIIGLVQLWRRRAARIWDRKGHGARSDSESDSDSESETETEAAQRCPEVDALCDAVVFYVSMRRTSRNTCVSTQLLGT